MKLTETRSTVDDDGAILSELVYGDVGDDQYDKVVFRIPTDGQIACRCYIDENVVESYTFTTREMVFDPISVIGRGESEQALGVRPVDEATETELRTDGWVSWQLQTALHAMGLTAVPSGREWMDTA